MTAVLFIHGTGVREPKYQSTFAQIRDGLHDVRPDLDAQSCYWGEIGADLRAGGASFFFDPPPRRRQRASDPALPDGPVAEEEKELARWAQLLTDPLFEVRVYEFAEPDRTLVVTTTMADRVRAMAADPGVAAEFESQGLTEAFAQAVAWLTGAAEFRSAFDGVKTADGATRPLLARALVARCLVIVSAEDGRELPGDQRDRLVRAVVAGFGAPVRGPLDRVGRFSKDLACSAVEPWLHQRRLRSIEQVADILLYQARGDAIRQFVRDRIRQLPGPVVLLAHSLGGVIAFDLLAGPDASELGHVRMLITVGSQVPLLYELGALSSGDTYPSGLPGGFGPRWVNVYDERDLLAYAGAELFGDGCRDLRVDNRAPFPAVHGAYWGLSDLYRQLAEVMEGENL